MNEKVRLVRIVPGMENKAWKGYIQAFCRLRRQVYQGDFGYAGGSQDGSEPGDAECTFILVVTVGSNQVVGGVRIAPPSVTQTVYDYTEERIPRGVEIARLILKKEYRGEAITLRIWGAIYIYARQVGIRDFIAAAVDNVVNKINWYGFPMKRLGEPGHWPKEGGKKQVQVTPLTVPLTGLLRHLFRTNKKTWVGFVVIEIIFLGERSWTWLSSLFHKKAPPKT